jgi:hypothetical protein
VRELRVFRRGSYVRYDWAFYGLGYDHSYTMCPFHSRAHHVWVNTYVKRRYGTVVRVAPFGWLIRRLCFAGWITGRVYGGWVRFDRNRFGRWALRVGRAYVGGR